MAAALCDVLGLLETDPVAAREEALEARLDRAAARSAIDADPRTLPAREAASTVREPDRGEVVAREGVATLWLERLEVLPTRDELLEPRLDEPIELLLLADEPALRLMLAPLLWLDPPLRPPPPLRCAATGTEATNIAISTNAIAFEVFIRLLLSFFGFVFCCKVTPFLTGIFPLQHLFFYFPRTFFPIAKCNPMKYSAIHQPPYPHTFQRKVSTRPNAYRRRHFLMGIGAGQKGLPLRIRSVLSPYPLRIKSDSSRISIGGHTLCFRTTFGLPRYALLLLSPPMPRRCSPDGLGHPGLGRQRRGAAVGYVGGGCGRKWSKGQRGGWSDGAKIFWPQSWSIGKIA